MDFAKFINQHERRQYRYYDIDGTFAEQPDEVKADLIQKTTSYIIEECTEVNRELAHLYKPFKKVVALDEKALLEEISDIFLYAAGLVAVAGFTGEEIEEMIGTKLDKNSTRTDHVAPDSKLDKNNTRTDHVTMEFYQAQDALDYGDYFSLEYSYDSIVWWSVKDLEHLESLPNRDLLQIRFSED